MYNGGRHPAVPVACDCLCAAEVHQDDAAADFTHHVVRLDVAMHQARSMECGQRSTQIDADARDLARTHRPRFPHHLHQRAAFDVLHPDADVIRIALGAIDDHHVRVADARETARFVQRRLGIHAVLREKLHRDVAVQGRIPRPIHASKCACADGFEENDVTPVADRNRGVGGIGA
jgi:hypothetical protein